MKVRFIVLLLSLFVLLLGCAGIGKYTSIPSPQPGLILPVNGNQAVWAECWLFKGSFRRDELIIPHATGGGKLTFVKSPLKHFIIDPPMTQLYKNDVMSSVSTFPLKLPPYRADYTLLVFHKNFRGWVRKIETRWFSTTGNAFNEFLVSGGRKIYADRVIELAKCGPYPQRQFRIHKTIYPGHMLKDALGLP